MGELNSISVVNFAKEFTLTAMQNNMITASSDPKDTAKNVVDFYQTIVNSINKEV